MSPSTRLPAALRVARASLASASATFSRDPSPATEARVHQLRAEYNVLALVDHIRRVIDQGPPLTNAQRDRLIAQVRRTPAARPASRVVTAKTTNRDWVTLHEAVDLLGLSRVEVRQLVHDGTLRSRTLRDTNILQIDRADIDQMRDGR